MLIFWEEGIRMRMSHHFEETLPGHFFFKDKAPQGVNPYDRYKWSYGAGPYKWPKINGKTGGVSQPYLIRLRVLHF